MNKEIDDLLNKARKAGKLSDKNRGIILNKAVALGEDKDEIELILESIPPEKTSVSDLDNFNTRKIRKVNKCPNCGASILDSVLKCPECGYVFSTTNDSELSHSINSLQNKLLSCGTSVDQKEIVIRTFTIPNTKDALINFLIFSYSSYIASKNDDHPKIANAWCAKTIETYKLIKAHAKDDKDLLKILDEYSDIEKIAKHKINIRFNKKTKFFIFISAVLLFILIGTDWITYLIWDIEDLFEKETPTVVSSTSSSTTYIASGSSSASIITSVVEMNADSDNQSDMIDSVSQSGNINGYSFVDLGLTVLWATSNIGASACSDHGCYYSWGEILPKESYRISDYFERQDPDTKLSVYYNADNPKVESKDDPALSNMNYPWRMPTIGEMRELINNCDWTAVRYGNQVGVLGKSKLNKETIFFPRHGIMENYSLENDDFESFYWSSSIDDSDDRYAVGLLIQGFTVGLIHPEDISVKINTERRYYGAFVRAVSSK